jgi:hypothetical protein
MWQNYKWSEEDLTFPDSSAVSSRLQKPSSVCSHPIQLFHEWSVKNKVKEVLSLLETRTGEELFLSHKSFYDHQEEEMLLKL